MYSSPIPILKGQLYKTNLIFASESSNVNIASQLGCVGKLCILLPSLLL
ncbi:putative orphan protein [Pseudoalteromonas translucida]|uniref:Orphan protein n=1 Tax=Pseudoalteromonas translucida (strain TAC 125) TaxID=326442 RepID=Q3ILR7_PSET1|nr:putative orphan protein [Pseudoalteromonas translucida]